MDIGKEIRKLRKMNKLTQVKLAEIIGVDRSAISSYETGRRDLTISRLKQISRALHVKPEHFFQDCPDEYSFFVENLDKKSFEILYNTYIKKCKHNK